MFVCIVGEDVREGGSRSRKLSGAGGGRLFRDLDLLAEYMFSSSAYTADSLYGGRVYKKKKNQSKTSYFMQDECTSDLSFPVGMGLFYIHLLGCWESQAGMYHLLTVSLLVPTSSLPPALPQHECLREYASRLKLRWRTPLAP